MLGSNNLPDKWISPLNDSLESLVPGFHKIKISDLAQRIIMQIKL